MRDPAELAQFRLPIAGGQSIPLSEVAVVRDATGRTARDGRVERASRSSASASRSAGDGNTVKVAAGVQEAVEKLWSELPSDYRLSRSRERGLPCAIPSGTCSRTRPLGILLAGVLLFVFPHDSRQTLIAAVAMPISVVATFMLMQSSGFTLNVMSLMALGDLGRHAGHQLHRGAENIGRLGQGRRGAVRGRRARHEGSGYRGARPDAHQRRRVHADRLHERRHRSHLPAVRPDRRLCHECSLVVSFTLVPMLAARMVRPGQGVGHGEGLGARLARGWNRAYDGLAAAYGRSLAWSLDRKWVPLAVTSLVLVGSLVLFRFVGGEFIPTTDQGQCQVLIELPEGTSLSRTGEVADRVARIAGAHPEVEGVMVKVGGEARGIEDAAVLVRLKPVKERSLGVNAFMNVLRPELAGIPDARLSVSAVGEARAGQADLEIEILADDPTQLLAAAGSVYEVVQPGCPGLPRCGPATSPASPN
ncbi:MAG: efflux RND transporter permease subunit [bacterium]|nr:efflux RND transporter permease subunit [bacterium]